MDTLYSMDEHLKMHQQNIEKEIGDYRLIKLAKASQSHLPGITVRFVLHVQAILSNFLSRLECVIARKVGLYSSKSNTGINPC